MTLQTQRVQTLEQVRRVTEGNEAVDFALADRASAYEFIRRTLVQFDYAALGKADKGAVKAYAVLRRQYEAFGDERFARLARPSNRHLYNLRASRTYRRR